MKRILLMAAIVAAIPLSQSNADYSWSIPGPTNVGTTAVPLALNDVNNIENVTVDTYTSYEITADWTAGSGSPWSSEARINLTWVGALGGGTTGEIIPDSGGTGSGAPASLSWSGNFADTGTDYEVDNLSDASINLDLRQTFGGSDANWANINVTFFSAPPPITPPTTIATFDLTLADSYTYNDAHVSGEVDWFKIIHPGGLIELMNSIGSDFDTEIGLYDSNGDLVANDDDSGGSLTSSLDGQVLATGTYYLAASGFDTTFNGAFFGVVGGTAAGNLNLRVALIPEPSSAILIAGLFGIAFAVRRRRKTA